MGGRQADFSIHYLKDIEIFGVKVSITTTHVSMLIISTVLLAIAFIVNRKLKKVKPEDTPGTLQNLFEIAISMLDNMVHGIMGDNDRRFRNYITCVFMFALLCNISGLWGLRPPTADYGVTLPLGLITFFMIHYCGVKKNKHKHFTALFQPTPILFPINFIGEIAVPLSLSLRLFGNVLSGTVMMGLIYGLLLPPITTGIPAFLHIYFDIFSGCIQAYVFCMLSMVYINDKIAD